MDEVLRICQLSNAKHMLFLMDACYSGLMTESVKGLSKPEEEGYLSKVANKKARQIITAGDSDEQVIERDEWQHSAFTKNLLEGLDTWEADYNKDGYITADELSTYLRENVTVDSDFQQTPQDGRFKNSGGGEFVFFSDATITIPSSNIEKEDEIIYGCMDKRAENYNPDATKPDRSCQYIGEFVTSIKFGEFDKINKTVPIIISNTESISGFQFSLSGATIISNFGGISEEAGFEILINENMLVGMSFNPILSETNLIQRGGNQILINIKIKPDSDSFSILNEICLNDIILSDGKGESISFQSISSCFNPKK